MPTPAWIGLGSNLGDRIGTLDAALAALDATPGVTVLAVSHYRETLPVGGPRGQGAFLNAAALLETTLGPVELLAAAQAVEDRLGRVRSARWGERTIDLDLLVYGEKFLETKELKLPHPRMALRRFVLGPLAELAPGLVDVVTGRTVADLLANLDRRPRLLALDGQDGRRKAAVFRRLVEELPAFGIAGKEASSGDLAGGLEGKIDALRADRWESETLRVPWIVADYDVGLELRRTRWPSPPDPSEPGAASDLREAPIRALAAAKAALPPTFVVILPGDREVGRGPGRLRDPMLRPESDKPDAIVAEVLATCRGIDHV